MVNKTKKMVNIDFLDGFFGETIKEIPKIEKKAEKKVVPTKAQKLDNSKMLNVKGGGTFLFAGNGFAPDGGSPSQFMGKSSNNSIWDSEVIERLSSKKGGDEIIKEAREKQYSVEQERAKDRMDGIVNELKDVDLRKDASIVSCGSYNEGVSNYKAPTNAISIFDTDFNFGKIPEKTEGEKIVEARRNPKEKDKSSVSNKQVSTSGIMDKLYESLTSEKNSK